MDKNYVKSTIEGLKSTSSSRVQDTLLKIRSKVITNDSGIQLFRDCGGLEYLLPHLRKPNERILDLTLSILGNCCLEDESSLAVGKLNYFGPLVSILKTVCRDSIVGRACRVIGNLAQKTSNAESLHNHGVVTALITLIESRDKNTSYPTLTMAVRAVRQLWMVPEKREEMLTLNAVRCIAILLTTECESAGVIKSTCNSSKEGEGLRKSQEELICGILKCLGYFTTHASTLCAEQIQGDGRGYQCLVALTKTYESVALKCLMNLCYLSSCRPLLGTAGLVECLVRILLKNSEVSYWQKTECAARALAQLSGESVNRSRLRHCGGLPLLLAAARVSPDAMRALLQYVFDDTSFQILVSKGLINLLTDELTTFVATMDFEHNNLDNTDLLSAVVAAFKAEEPSDTPKSTVSLPNIDDGKSLFVRRRGPLASRNEDELKVVIERDNMIVGFVDAVDSDASEDSQSDEDSAPRRKCLKRARSRSPMSLKKKAQLIKMASKDWSAGVYWEPKSPEWPSSSRSAMSPDRPQSPLSPYAEAGLGQPGFPAGSQFPSSKRARLDWSPESGVSTGEGSSMGSPYWKEYQWSPSSSCSPTSPLSINEESSDSEISGRYSPVLCEAEGEAEGAAARAELDAAQVAHGLDELIMDDDESQDLAPTAESAGKIDNSKTSRIACVLVLLFRVSHGACNSLGGVREEPVSNHTLELLTGRECLNALLDYVEKCKRPLGRAARILARVLRYACNSLGRVREEPVSNHTLELLTGRECLNALLDYVEKCKRPLGRAARILARVLRYACNSLGRVREEPVSNHTLELLTGRECLNALLDYVEKCKRPLGRAARILARVLRYACNSLGGVREEPVSNHTLELLTGRECLNALLDYVEKCKRPLGRAARILARVLRYACNSLGGVREEPVSNHTLELLTGRECLNALLDYVEKCKRPLGRAARILARVLRYACNSLGRVREEPVSNHTLELLTGRECLNALLDYVEKCKRPLGRAARILARVLRYACNSLGGVREEPVSNHTLELLTGRECLNALLDYVEKCKRPLGRAARILARVLRYACNSLGRVREEPVSNHTLELLTGRECLNALLDYVEKCKRPLGRAARILARVLRYACNSLGRVREEPVSNHTLELLTGRECLNALLDYVEKCKRPLGRAARILARVLRYACNSLGGVREEPVSNHTLELLTGRECLNALLDYVEKCKRPLGRAARILARVLRYACNSLGRVREEPVSNHTLELLTGRECLNALLDYVEKCKRPLGRAARILARVLRYACNSLGRVREEPVSNHTLELLTGRECLNALLDYVEKCKRPLGRAARILARVLRYACNSLGRVREEPVSNHTLELLTGRECLNALLDYVEKCKRPLGRAARILARVLRYACNSLGGVHEEPVSNHTLELLTGRECLNALLDYVEKCKRPLGRAARILARVLSNALCLMSILKHRLALRLHNMSVISKHPPTKCQQCKQILRLSSKLLAQLTILAESSYGIGEISYQLLKGSLAMQQTLSITLPYIVRTEKPLKKYFIDCGALNFLFDIISESKEDMKVCVTALSKLASNVHIKDPKSLENRFKEQICVSYDPILDNLTADDIVTFELDDKSYVNANKIFLCQNSEVFSAMLMGCFKESAEKCVTLKNVTKPALEYLFTLLHFGLNNPKCDVQVFPLADKLETNLEVLLLADRFLFDKLKGLLSSAILQFQLTPETADKIYVWSLSEGMGFLCVESVAYLLTGKMCESQRAHSFSAILELEYKDQWLDDIKTMIVRQLVK